MYGKLEIRKEHFDYGRRYVRGRVWSSDQCDQHLAASRLLGNCQCYKGWSECRCPLSCKTVIFLYIYISLYIYGNDIGDITNCWHCQPLVHTMFRNMCSALVSQLEPPVGSRQMVCWHRYGQKSGDPKFDLMAYHHFAHSIGNFGSFGGIPNFWERFGLTPAVFFVTCLGIYSCFTPSLAKHG